MTTALDSVWSGCISPGTKGCSTAICETIAAVHRGARCLLAAGLMVSAPYALAQSSGSRFIQGGEEAFTLKLGGIVNQFGTTVRLDGQGQRGDEFDLEKNGLDDVTATFQVEATWRFLSRNRIDVLYFQSSRSGNRQLDRTLHIQDKVFPINYDFAAEAKNQFLLADYRFSFVKTEKIELAGALGVYAGRFSYDFTANGGAVGSPQVVNAQTATTVPLPLIGVTLDWYVNPRWKLSGSVSGAKANIDDVDGSILVAGASAEFMLARHFGVGVAYMYSNLSAEVSKRDFTGELGWRMNSVLAYALIKL